MYESPELLLRIFGEEDIVRTSSTSSEKTWEDGNADGSNGWTNNY